MKKQKMKMRPDPDAPNTLLNSLSEAELKNFIPVWLELEVAPEQQSQWIQKITERDGFDLQSVTFESVHQRLLELHRQTLCELINRFQDENDPLIFTAIWRNDDSSTFLWDDDFDDPNGTSFPVVDLVDSHHLIPLFEKAQEAIRQAGFYGLFEEGMDLLGAMSQAPLTLEGEDGSGSSEDYIQEFMHQWLQEQAGLASETSLYQCLVHNLNRDPAIPAFQKADLLFQASLKHGFLNHPVLFRLIRTFLPSDSSREFAHSWLSLVKAHPGLSIDVLQQSVTTVLPFLEKKEQKEVIDWAGARCPALFLWFYVTSVRFLEDENALEWLKNTISHCPDRWTSATLNRKAARHLLALGRQEEALRFLSRSFQNMKSDDDKG